MTVPVVGPPESAQADHADCGTLAGNAWVQAFAPDAALLPTMDNTFATTIADAINALGVAGLRAVAEWPADVNAYVSQWLPTGAGFMVPVRVDSWDCTVNPSGDAEHWIDPFASSDSAVAFYNCWPAALQTVDPATLQAAYAPRADIGCVRITYTPPQPSKEDEEVSLLIIATENDQGQATGSYLVHPESGAAGGIANDAAPQLPHVTMPAGEFNRFIEQAQKAASTGA